MRVGEKRQRVVNNNLWEHRIHQNHQNHLPVSYRINQVRSGEGQWSTWIFTFVHTHIHTEYGARSAFQCFVSTTCSTYFCMCMKMSMRVYPYPYRCPSRTPSPSLSAWRISGITLTHSPSDSAPESLKRRRLALEAHTLRCTASDTSNQDRYQYHRYIRLCPCPCLSSSALHSDWLTARISRPPREARPRSTYQWHANGRPQ